MIKKKKTVFAIRYDYNLKENEGLFQQFFGSQISVKIKYSNLGVDNTRQLDLQNKDIHFVISNTKLKTLILDSKP